MSIQPRWLIGPIQFDHSRTKLYREELLKPFANSEGKTWRAYSYWMNRQMDEEDSKKTCEECSEEVQNIRNHLWAAIVKDENAAKSSFSMKLIGTIIIVTIIFLGIFVPAIISWIL